jgi:hypothetical protein
MKSDSKESLRKWGPLTVAFLALIPAYLMGPIAFTFKATVKDMLRQELAGHETTSASQAKWTAQQTRDNEILTRLDYDLSVLRDKAAISKSNDYRLLMEFSNRLVSLELQFKRLITEYERNGRQQREKDGP